jgi:hypothetical protein
VGPGEIFQHTQERPSWGWLEVLIGVEEPAHQLQHFHEGPPATRAGLCKAGNAKVIEEVEGWDAQPAAGYGRKLGRDAVEVQHGDG